MTKLLTLAGALLATLAVAVLPAGGAEHAAAGVKVAFLRGEQVVYLQRPGSSVEAAVRALLAGPTAAEQRLQTTTQVPSGTPLRGVRVEGRVATVDLGERFVAGTRADSLDARLTQLVLTVTAVPGVRSVRVLVKGGVPLGLFPSFVATEPISAADATAPTVPPPRPPSPSPGPGPTSGTRALQQRLAELGYLPPAAVDGQYGEQTRFAVVAFQKWEGLARDGEAGPATQAALARATRPTPRTNGNGTRAEVLLDRQLLLFVEGGTVTRTLHVSSGAPGYETPTGRYSVFRKEARSWSVPYKVWLPWASYFVGGVAFHESPDVPATAASHGCVRVPRYDAKWLYDRMPVGTAVTVLGSSR